MTDNVTIRIGANASQAISEIGRVKKAAGGLRGGAMGRLAGGATSFIGSSLGLGGLASMARLGPAGMAIGGGILAGREVGKGFASQMDAYPQFMEAMATVSGALQKFGVMLANEILPRLGVVAEWLGLAKGKPSPYGAITAKEKAEFDAKLAATREAVGWKPRGALTEKQLKLQADQTEYMRETVATLHKIEQDISMTEMFDPW